MRPTDAYRLRATMTTTTATATAAAAAAAAAITAPSVLGAFHGGSGGCRAPSVAGCPSHTPRPRLRPRPRLLPWVRPAPAPAPAPSGLSPAMRRLFRGGGDAILSSGVCGVEPGRAARSGAGAERGRQGTTAGHEFSSLHREASGTMIRRVPSASAHAL